MQKVLAALLLLLLSGCAPSLPHLLALDPATAQTAIEDSLHKIVPTQPIANVIVRRIEAVPDGAVAFFTYETENEAGMAVTATGVHDLKREGLIGFPKGVAQLFQETEDRFHHLGT